MSVCTRTDCLYLTLLIEIDRNLTLTPKIDQISNEKTSVFEFINYPRYTKRTALFFNLQYFKTRIENN